MSANIMPMTLRSPAFENFTDIPRRFTCDGENVSPPLFWTDVPHNAQSLALMIEDPDAPDPAKPERIWVHWLLYNIPVTVHELPENADEAGLPDGALSGNNDWNHTEYGGPCPPVGKHHYFHRLFALDTVLTDLHHPTKTQLHAAMRSHILQEAVLTGTYQRHKRRELRK